MWSLFKFTLFTILQAQVLFHHCDELQAELDLVSQRLPNNQSLHFILLIE